MTRCTFKQGNYNCGSYAFNLYKEDIDQGSYCDRHYWQDQANWTNRKPLYTHPPRRTEQDHIPDARKMVTEQEPVVGIAAIRTWFKDGRVVTQTLCNSWIDTTPPQRTWVGLTDEDVNGFVGQYWGDEYMKMRSMVRAIEAKLKEKNT